MEKVKIINALLLVGTISFVGFTGCKCLHPVASTESGKTSVTTVTLHDTTLIIAPDSSSIRAYLSCDSLNHVILEQLAVEKGRVIKTDIKWLRPGVIEVAAKTDSQAIYLAYKEKYTVDTVTNTTQVAADKPPWYKTIITNTILSLLACLIAFVVFKIISLFKK